MSSAGSAAGGAGASAAASAAEKGSGVDFVSVTIAGAVVVALFLWCSRRRRRGGVVPAAAPPPNLSSSSASSTGAGGAAPTPEPEEEPLVVEETMTATNTNPAFAETPNTESLFQMMQQDDFEAMAKQVNSLDEVSAVMHKAGLEHCNLIFGIDYTGSNYLQGKKTFGGKCLHDINDRIQNPYQCVIATLGETLEPFASDGVIPAFGFGDAFTKDHSVFPLRPDLNGNPEITVLLLADLAIPSGFKEVLEIYNKLTPKVRLGGPTNFAPLIRQAVDIVKATNKYHILVIVADGQVTNERATTEAIVEASHHPLSIITVGVGDGPWDTMVEFDEKLPKRTFDNFHFVDYAKVTQDMDNPSAAFAIQALSEVPDQYREIKKLNLL